MNAAVRLNVGETAAGEYELLPENTTEKTLKWSSADEAIVTVNAEGRMTGVAPGTTKVTGVTKDGSNRKAVYTVYVPTLAVPETEYTISEMSGLTIPVSYYGDDFEKNITVKVTGKPVLYTTQYENNRIELHLDALEAGDSKIEIADKKDGKAKLALTVHTEETAIWNSLLVEIAGLKLQWKRGDLFLSYNFINHSSRKVTGVKYALDFRTQSGGQEFYPCLFEGTDIPSVGQFW
ncbi:MAG: Ig-like domain-containing protein, partial [Eubacteriales bacterium]